MAYIMFVAEDGDPYAVRWDNDFIICDGCAEAFIAVLELEGVVGFFCETCAREMLR